MLSPATGIINGCRTTRIYCRPGCPPGRRTLPRNRVYFASREEARAGGYRPCKVCKPDGPDPQPETFVLRRHRGALGVYVIGASKAGVVLLKPEDQERSPVRRWLRSGVRMEEGPGNEHVETAVRELDDYFAGRLRQFAVPLDLRGTPFQRAVWDLLRRIPYGETWTYGQVARTVGWPGASKAVGHAIGSNPVSIVVPCHRVVGCNGNLTGYGGGLDRKRALLRLEGVL